MEAVGCPVPVSLRDHASLRVMGDQDERPPTTGKYIVARRHGGSPVRGPDGQRRPAGTYDNAVRVGRISVGLAVDRPVDPAKAAAGREGGRRRSEALDPARRRRIAQRAAQARWSEVRDGDD